MRDRKRNRRAVPNLHPPHRKRALLHRKRLDDALLVAVDKPLRHRLRIRIGGDFPDFGRVFQSRDKAGAARRLIDGAHPRCMSLDVADLDDLGDGQVGAIEDDDSVGEIIGGG